MQIKIKQKLLFISATSLVVLALVTTNLLFSMRKWSPLRQEPEAPSNNATSRNCELALA
jgi:hypothetical protein